MEKNVLYLKKAGVKVQLYCSETLLKMWRKCAVKSIAFGRIFQRPK
jgi:hypothetical protein